MITKLLQKEEGIALPTVVVIIAIITLLGFTAFFLVSSQTAMGNRYEKSETAYYCERPVLMNISGA